MAHHNHNRIRRRHRLTITATLVAVTSAGNAPAAGTSTDHLLSLTETNFDVLLREVPVALICYVGPGTELRFPKLLPALRDLAAAYEYAGIGVGRVPSEYTELLDRFQVDEYPTLHWMDGSRKWPYYASEATPERYSGPRGYEALAGFIEAKTGIPPKPPEPVQATAADADADARAEPTARERAHAAAHEHECIGLSAHYQACLRHKPASLHRECASERHDYLLCMSGRWAVHPEHHEHLAGMYGRFVGEDEPAPRSPPPVPLPTPPVEPPATPWWLRDRTA